MPTPSRSNLKEGKLKIQLTREMKKKGDDLMDLNHLPDLVFGHLLILPSSFFLTRSLFFLLERLSLAREVDLLLAQSLARAGSGQPWESPWASLMSPSPLLLPTLLER